MLRVLPLALCALALSAARCAAPADAPAPPNPPPVPEAPAPPRPPGPPPAVGTPFVLAQGETTTVEGLGVTFAEVTEDSRCPRGVACVWQGRATVRLALQEGTTTGEVLVSIMGLSGDADPVEALGHRFTLQALEPYPGAPVEGAPPPPARDEATLLVERL